MLRFVFPFLIIVDRCRSIVATTTVVMAAMLSFQSPKAG
jgi:hypothetical protein